MVKILSSYHGSTSPSDISSRVQAQPGCHQTVSLWNNVAKVREVIIYNTLLRLIIKCNKL